MHDVGHPFSAHDGEEILTLISRLYNTGYFHHNAKGIETIISEDICHKAINKISNLSDEQKKQLEEEFPCFLDVVISHDGEATRKDMKKKPEQYKSIQDAVFDKLSRSNSLNDYKFIAQDPEGRIGKIADVLAYLPTDIQDGFRLGIIKKFDEDFLFAFGMMFSDREIVKENDSTYSSYRDEMIYTARDRIINLMGKKIKELEEDTKDPQNTKIIEYVNETRKKALDLGIRIEELGDDDCVALNKLIEDKAKEIESTRKKRNKQSVMSEISRFKSFMERMISINSSVVEEITNSMREYFISDFIQNSRETGKMEFSQKAEELFFLFKRLNYEKIVRFTKLDYQTEILPGAVKKLVDLCANALVKSGTIRDMFYDDSIRNRVKNESKEAERHMKVKKQDEKKYEKYKKKIAKIKITFDSAKFKNAKPKKFNKILLRRRIIDFTMKKGEIFAIKYLNVFNAIPHTVKDNVECALSDDRLNDNSLLRDFQAEVYAKLRARMINEYGSLLEAKKHKDEFIKRLIREERSDMETKIARQFAVDFIAGETDRSIVNLAIKTGYMTRGQVFNAQRPRTSNETVERRIADLKSYTKENHNGEGR